MLVLIPGRLGILERPPPRGLKDFSSVESAPLEDFANELDDCL